MPETPPTAEELAHWLLANEVGEHRSHEELTMAAIRIHEHLRDHLAVFLGNQGFDALWARAIHLTRRTFPWEGHESTSGASAPPQAIHAAVHGRDVDETRALLLTIFTHFFSVLFSFIGANLVFRLLQQHWLALGTSITGEHDQEAAQ